MAEKVNSDEKAPEPLNVHEIGDRCYELYQRTCPSCGKDHFEIHRWAGGSFSRYRLPHDLDNFDEEDFKAYSE